jgi:hypothetical protein
LVSAHKVYIFSFCGGFCSQILYNFYEAREISIPLLFSVFLNDLTEFMSHAYNDLNDVCNISHLFFDNEDIEVYFKLYLLLYADDTVIFAETAAEFQSALNAMYLYCETWKLKVNTAKTNVVIFSKSRQSENIDFIYNNEQL